MNERNPLGMENDVRLTAKIMLVAMAIGFVFVSAQQYFQDATPSGGRIFFASLWSLACLAVGGLVGFLFGIPRWLQTDIPAAAPEGAAEGNAGASLPQTTPRRAISFSPNTNLDRISDWLTTILVGVGLVELESLAAGFRNAAEHIGQGLGEGASNVALAGAIIVYFSVVGFLGVYLMTRLYLSQIIKGVEDLLGIDANLRQEMLRSDLSNPMRPGLTNHIGDLKKILGVALEALTDPAEIVIWAKAQFRAQNYSNAIAGYKKAIELLPADIQLRLEYANALFYAGLRPSGEVNQFRPENEKQLLAAYGLLGTSPDPETMMKVYRALTFFYLYEPAPEGFENTIKYGTEFLQSSARKISSGGLLVNLAAAYGQKCVWIETTDPGNNDAFCGAFEALKACSSAIQMNKERWADRLRTLIQSNVKKDPTDNDLEIFERDNQFRILLGLEPLAAAADTSGRCP